MPRVQLLPTARPHPYAGQNIAAFGKILQTWGALETIRRKKLMDSDILLALKRGTTPEEVAGIVQTHQQPTYDPGLRGTFQRIASPFAQAPGAGITDALTKGTMESAFKTISPTQQIAQFRLQNINALKAKIERTPEEEAELKRLIGPTPAVQIGRMPWELEPLTPDERREAAKAKAAADKAKAEAALKPSEKFLETARVDIKNLLDEHANIEGVEWFPFGRKNFTRKDLLSLYEQYQVNRNYGGLTAVKRRAVDKQWDSLMKLHNREGYNVWNPAKKNFWNVGKNEFDWDPKDPRVQALRKEAVEQLRGTTGGLKTGLTPETAKLPAEEVLRLLMTKYMPDYAVKYTQKMIDDGLSAPEIIGKLLFFQSGDPSVPRPYSYGINLEAFQRDYPGSLDYDYESARKAGFGPDKTGHWPSQFKSDTSPERYIDGLDTKTASLQDVINTYTKLARQQLGPKATPEQVAKKAKAMAKAKGWKIE